ncbi:MAG TPA: hypothetical protein PKH14_05680 [Syntrophorhabdus sp.]|nr:hypothetical protein [Syntrophorhabdus sp.]
MSPRQIEIEFSSENFPIGSIVQNGPGVLKTSWDELLWAAVTVGRPNRHYVFRHGDASVYEAIFRWSLVRMSLEQRGFYGYRLRRTDSVKTLDPTEKGAVNYFLGMIFCKLFAAKLLNTPWLLHLDVFRRQLNTVLTGRSRPDLIGMEHGSCQWHAFECKGRISPPGRDVKDKAKQQAHRIVSVNGTPCSLHVGAITFFSNDALQFYWCDPVSEVKNPIEIQFSDEAWQYYYAPIMQIITKATRMGSLQKEGAIIPIEELDLQVSIHPAVEKYLLQREWSSAVKAAFEAKDEMIEAGYQPDGLAVRAGDTWHTRFEESSFNQ